MKLFNQFSPGLSLTHKKVNEIISAKDDSPLLHLTKSEIQIVENNLQDYLMYIWLQMGDTRFNRSGYRNAIDILEKNLTKTRRTNASK